MSALIRPDLGMQAQRRAAADRRRAHTRARVIWFAFGLLIAGPLLDLAGDVLAALVLKEVHHVGSATHA